VLAFIREYKDDRILCVNNLSRFVQPTHLSLERYSGWTLEELFGKIPFPAITDAPYFVTLGPHNFFWFRLVPPAGGSAA
jgi:maltose alpha-D-glucosyltransferase/alpha-amylase